MTVGPGNEGAGAGRRRHMRAADADREQVIDTLKAAFTQGRLTKRELDQRVGLALESLTYADLDALTSDIPRDLVAPSAPVPAPETIKAPAGVAGPHDRAIVATGTLAGVAIVVAFLVNDGAVSALLALGGVASALVFLTLLVTQLRAAGRGTSRGGQPPEVRARDTGHAAELRQAPGTKLPGAEPGRQSTTDIASTRRPRPQVVVIA